jgi:superfamily II DNA or RNA helicase/HKD family nuclease
VIGSLADFAYPPTVRKPRLVDGVYEHLITRDLRRALDALESPRQTSAARLEPADSHSLLARHLAAEIERALDTLPMEERPHAQIAIVNRLLTDLGSLAPKASELLVDAQIDGVGEQLRAVFRNTAPERPVSPLASSTLLTRNRVEPSLGSELNREIASADRIDVLVAFITMHGVRALRDSIEQFVTRVRDDDSAEPRLRVLTTVFTGTTEVAAVEALARLPGVSVKVSYDTRRTRLHAKAWLFHRDSQLHTAYVGSANLTATALGSGQEWMVKACAADLPHVIEKFRGTFDSLWNDPEFEAFAPNSPESTARLSAALGKEGRDQGPLTRLFALRPFPYQEEILDRLEAERVVHGRCRNLVVAATGTGKTLIAAFDYQRQAERAGTAPRLLFLAHRRELLEQARETFRHVLHDGAFGELLIGGDEPVRWQHVFATIQTAANRDLVQRFGAEHFQYVVVDECHHAPATSYQQIIPILRCSVLLGLTATPERTDGRSLLPDFDNHIAAELRIWHALERQLLVPFEYYGVSDNVDLTRLRWGRAGYDTEELGNIYTGNEARVDLVVAQLTRRVADPASARAIAFCVSVRHAEFMAAALSKRGIKALAVHGDTSEEIRQDAPRRLRAGEVSVLCTCHLYNEGVDLPFVDTLLLLRPTASATLFLQQLGRGLRHHRGKSSCLVLDFIGRHRAEFRFDGLYSALTGIPRSRLVKAVDESFPYLPSGCILQLDAVAREQVLAGLRANLTRRSRLVEEVRELSREDPNLTLPRFLDFTGREVEDVYLSGDGWSNLRSEAGVARIDADASDLSRRLGWLLHVDDRTRLNTWAEIATASGDATADRLRLYTMFNYALVHRGVLKTAEELAAYVSRAPELVDELRQLGQVLDERISLANETRPVQEWPLVLHRHYTRREILAAIGYVKTGEKGKLPQGGILKVDGQREILFVTLDKSGRSFSPTTRYRDHAISPTLFHWETQSWTSIERPSGKRYVDSETNGWSFHLFVRTDPDAVYAYVGPVKYLKHQGDRPIAITWRLEHALPAVLYQRFATLASG